jgi:hypothetical protein
MYTSIMLLALAAPAADVAPRWHSDYALAYRMGQAEGKPLAIFVGRGEAGWRQVCNDRALGQEADRLLQANYVALYLDLDKDQAKSLASDLGLKMEGPALVISDRADDNIALRYSGKLEPGDLNRCLAKYADPQRIARATDTDPNQETRYYQPAETAPSRQFFTPGFGGFGGGRSC